MAAAVRRRRGHPGFVALGVGWHCRRHASRTGLRRLSVLRAVSGQGTTPCSSSSRLGRKRAVAQRQQRRRDSSCTISGSSRPKRARRRWHRTATSTSPSISARARTSCGAPEHEGETTTRLVALPFNSTWRLVDGVHFVLEARRIAVNLWRYDPETNQVVVVRTSSRRREGRRALRVRQPRRRPVLPALRVLRLAREVVAQRRHDRRYVRPVRRIDRLRRARA